MDGVVEIRRGRRQRGDQTAVRESARRSIMCGAIGGLQIPKAASTKLAEPEGQARFGIQVKAGQNIVWQSVEEIRHDYCFV
jgi:hypothetical protein